MAQMYFGIKMNFMRFLMANDMHMTCNLVHKDPRWHIFLSKINSGKIMIQF